MICKVYSFRLFQPAEAKFVIPHFFISVKNVVPICKSNMITAQGFKFSVTLRINCSIIPGKVFGLLSLSALT